MGKFDLPIIEIYETPDTKITPLGSPDDAEVNGVCNQCVSKDNVVCDGCKDPPPDL